MQLQHDEQEGHVIDLENQLNLKQQELENLQQQHQLNGDDDGSRLSDYVEPELVKISNEMNNQGTAVYLYFCVLDHCYLDVGTDDVRFRESRSLKFCLFPFFLAFDFFLLILGPALKEV